MVAIEWIVGAFFAIMLGLLVYSVVSTSIAIQKRLQIPVDSFFDDLSTLLSIKQSRSRANATDDSKHT
jgi:hypothetical protein